MAPSDGRTVKSATVGSRSLLVHTGSRTIPSSVLTAASRSHVRLGSPVVKQESRQALLVRSAHATDERLPAKPAEPVFATPHELGRRMPTVRPVGRPAAALATGIARC
jgi:hypothetical protein